MKQLNDQGYGHEEEIGEYLDLLTPAEKVLKGNILEGMEYPWYPFRGICPSLDADFRGIWNWDSAFHALGVSRFDTALAREQVLMWISIQLPSGELPDVLMEDGLLEDTYGKPPVMPWAAMIVDKRDPDPEFVKACYPAFVLLEKHWRLSRSSSDGLFFYDSRATDPRRRETETRWESGWDNSVRWDGGINNLYPVDLACYMILLYEALAYFARRVGFIVEANRWLENCSRIATSVNSILWNEEAGTWLDRDRFTGRFSKVITPACFMPVYVGIASRLQLSRSAEILFNANYFYPGMPTVAYNDSEFNSRAYWRGRSWLNVAWFALKGFRMNGFIEETDAMRSEILNRCREHGIRENYDSINGDGLGASGFGWSAAFVIEFILGWDERGD